jgi:hypothetical protein
MTEALAGFRICDFTGQLVDRVNTAIFRYFFIRAFLFTYLFT